MIYHHKLPQFATFLLLSLSFYSIAQPTPFDKKFVDSITLQLHKDPDDTTKVNHLVKLASMYLDSNPDVTVRYADEGAALAEKINFPMGQIACLGQAAFSLAIIGEWAKATIRINKAIPLCEKFQPKSLIYMNNLMCINATTRGDFKGGLEYALKAKNHPAFVSFSEIEKWPTYMQIGRMYDYINQLDSAKYYAQILDTFTKKYASIIPDLAKNCYTLFGNLALKRKDYTEAIQYYQLSSDYLGLANTYHGLNKPDSTIFYGTLSLEKGKSQSNPMLVLQASKLMADVYATSNPKESNKYWAIYADAKDNFYDADKLKQAELVNLNEQKNRFELQKLETEERNRLIQFIFSFVLIFFSIISILLWKNNRFKQKANIQLTTTLHELKSTQAQLIQSEKMASLGELTAGIAHEIQNPLNFVNNFSELSVDLAKELKEEVEKLEIPEKDKEYVSEIIGDLSQNQEKINHHGKRASSIVKGMLEHSRKSSGTKEPTDINALADEYLRLAYHGLRAKDKDFNATMETHFDSTLPKIDIIPQDIGRVLLNLITNAFYAVNEKNLSGLDMYEPKVIITTQLTTNNQVLIAIKDNGHGIPDAIKDKIFQPFFTTKPTGQGTGLGLSLSYDIVKAHGGDIKVESSHSTATEKAQIGSEFIITLPIV